MVVSLELVQLVLPLLLFFCRNIDTYGSLGSLINGKLLPFWPIKRIAIKVKQLQSVEQPLTQIDICV